VGIFEAAERLIMTLAAQLQDYLDARAARTAARQSARLERDAFILAQFPLLNARLVAMVGDAVGLHSRLATSTTALVEPVVGRSFASLNKTAAHVGASLDGTTQTVSFTPRLDFTELDQFGAVECAIDFSYRPRRSRRDEVAVRLLAHGVQMRGTSSAHLMFPASDGPLELSPGLLESALVALLLR
jgi:hypothetical protein